MSLNVHSRFQYLKDLLTVTPFCILMMRHELNMHGGHILYEGRVPEDLA